MIYAITTLQKYGTCVCVCVSTCMDVQIATQTHIPYRQLVTCIQQVPGLNLTWNTGYEDRNIE
jgi:hypothetical protein